ncbi:MAG: DUF1284 domain-containing protein [Clostridia bacterium]|nr:DUF1284 domain-containing protein [Clostridia bacterium]
MLELRPHHALCIQRFIGKGYSEDFTSKMWEVVSALKANPEQTVLFVKGEDELCAHCPHNQNGCVSMEKVTRMDELVGLSGEMKWSKAVEVANALPVTDICKNCEWYSLCHII